MSDRQLEEYLRNIQADPVGRQARHLALRDAHTVALTDNAPGTFEWATAGIAANLTDNERVLDIGCGNGQYLGYLLSRPGLVELGVGLDRHIRPLNLARFVSGNALALPFAAASFSAAMANRMLNQTGDIARALGEAARVLKPDGKIFVVTADSLQPSLLRQLHETAQAELNFPSYFYRSTTPLGQRLHRQNGTSWLATNFEQVRLEFYERVIVFAQVDEALEHYATGLLFQRAKTTDEANLPWTTLYQRVAQKLSEVMTQAGKIEIHEGATLFVSVKS